MFGCNRDFVILILVSALSILAILAGTQGKWDFCAAFATGVFALLKGATNEKNPPDTPPPTA